MIGACLDQIYTRNTQIKNSIFELKFEGVWFSDHDPVFYKKKLEYALIKTDNCLLIHTYIYINVCFWHKLCSRVTVTLNIFQR